jgi:hypothetical protein
MPCFSTGSKRVARSGFIWLHRKLLENPIWTDLAPAVTKVAIYFLLRANHKPSQWSDGKETVDIPAGAFITSYARTAADCNISIQQTRDAFAHLNGTQFGTQFATYLRTRRWTLVTVSNWAIYQAQQLDGNTPENTLGTSKRTTDKNIRNKHTPPTPSSEGEMFDLGHLPFDTLDQLPEKESTPPFPAAPKNGTAHHATLAAVASAIHSRHPNAHGRRDCSVAIVEKQLEAILKHKHVPLGEREDYLRHVEANHASICSSEQWTKNSGEFAKSLTNWLAPTKERYDIAPAGDAPRRLMA